MSIFEKNLACINEYDPVLAAIIKEHNFDSNSKFELIQSNSEDYNLKYNDILIHSEDDPQQEAVEIFNLLKNDNKSVNVIIGLGLGYLLRRHYLSSNSTVIVYEPNMDIIRFTLDIVDFSEELSSKRIFIINTRMQLTNLIEKYYNYGDNIAINALPSAKKLYFADDNLENIKKTLSNIQISLQENYICLFEKSPRWVIEGFNNIPDLAENYNIDALRDKFKSKPAVIVSPGPSLDKTIDILAKYRDKAVIIASGNSYRALHEHGIKPDFLTFIEIEDNSPQVKGFDISDINLIVQVISNNSIFKLEAKRKFGFFTRNDLFSKWIANLVKFPLEDYENKGTVSYCSLYSAFMMGCNPIILVGQDLAFSDGKCYSSDSAYSAVKYEKDPQTGKYSVKIDDMEDLLKYYVKDNIDTSYPIQHLLAQANADIRLVRGQNGEMLPTDPNYAGFINLFEQFAYKQSKTDLEMINCSVGGAQIDGFKNLPFEATMKNLPQLNMNIDTVIEESIHNYNDPVKQNIGYIADNIRFLLEDADNFITTAKEARKAALELKEIIDKIAQKPPDINKIQTLSNFLLECYVKLKDELIDSHIVLSALVFQRLLLLIRLLEDQSMANDIEMIKSLAWQSYNIYNDYLSFIPKLKDSALNTLEKLQT